MSEEKLKYNTLPIAEMTGGIVLANFEKPERRVEEYQTEAQLEENMINNLVAQGYERLDITTMTDLYENLRVQIEKLNDVKFSDSEWKRFLLEYLDTPNDGIVEKTRKIQENHIYDFIFDNGRLRNIKIIDKIIKKLVKFLILAIVFISSILEYNFPKPDKKSSDPESVPRPFELPNPINL